MPAPAFASIREGFRCLQFGSPQPSIPAVLWLHGAGERGSDLSAITQFGLPAALTQGRVHTEATVVCPQLDAGAEWEPERVRALTTALQREHPSVVAIGFSLGGLGLCDTLATYGLFTDLCVAISGRARELPTTSQRGVRLLALAGELDPWPQMSAFVHAVNGLGGIAEEQVLLGQSHFISEVGLVHPRFVELAAEVGLALHFGQDGG
jgi:predicted esterase